MRFATIKGQVEKKLPRGQVPSAPATSRILLQTGEGRLYLGMQRLEHAEAKIERPDLARTLATAAAVLDKRNGVVELALTPDGLGIRGSSQVRGVCDCTVPIMTWQGEPESLKTNADTLTRVVAGCQAKVLDLRACEDCLQIIDGPRTTMLFPE